MVRAAANLLGGLKGALRRRVARWAFKRQGPDTLPRTLERGRLYILPTRVGLVFAAIGLVMLAGSMNYSNSMGLALTFLLGALVLVSMHHCHRNLLALSVVGVSADPVFAGGTLQVRIRLRNPSPRSRYQLRGESTRGHSAVADIPAEDDGVFVIRFPAPQRGLVRLHRLGISTTHPFGLFRCWTWVHSPLECLVYPRPAPPGAPPPSTDIDVGGAQDDGQGSEDFAGLRPYRPGDSPRHIAWKAFARENTLLVKQFAGTSLATRWLDLALAPGADLEHRLSTLCRWVLGCDEQGHAYGLRLPGCQVEPGSGRSHRARCLEALARFGDSGEDAPGD